MIFEIMKVGMALGDFKVDEAARNDLNEDIKRGACAFDAIYFLKQDKQGHTIDIIYVGRTLYII